MTVAEFHSKQRLIDRQITDLQRVKISLVVELFVNGGQVEWTRIDGDLGFGTIAGVVPTVGTAGPGIEVRTDVGHAMTVFLSSVERFRRTPKSRWQKVNQP